MSPKTRTRTLKLLALSDFETSNTHRRWREDYIQTFKLRANYMKFNREEERKTKRTGEWKK